MSFGRVALAVAAGLALAALPFLRYAHFGGAEAHANHEARHGGQLGMAGEHHVELVRRGGAVEVYVSDPWRRPVRPEEGQVVFDRNNATPLVWEGHRLVTRDDAAAREAAVAVRLADGTRLSIGFDLSAPQP